MFALADGYTFETLMITNHHIIYIFSFQTLFPDNSKQVIGDKTTLYQIFKNQYYRNKIFRTKNAFIFVLF